MRSGTNLTVLKNDHLRSNSSRFSQDFAELLTTQTNSQAGYYADFIAMKKRFEAPRVLKSIDYDAVKAVPDYEKLDSARRLGVQSYLASKACINIIHVDNTTTSKIAPAGGQDIV